MAKTKNIIYYLRMQQGRTQREVAKETGLTENIVSKIENGNTTTLIGSLVALAKYYGITVDDILYEKG